MNVFSIIINGIIEKMNSVLLLLHWVKGEKEGDRVKYIYTKHRNRGEVSRRNLYTETFILEQSVGQKL